MSPKERFALINDPDLFKLMRSEKISVEKIAALFEISTPAVRRSTAGFVLLPHEEPPAKKRPRGPVRDVGVPEAIKAAGLAQDWRDWREAHGAAYATFHCNRLVAQMRADEAHERWMNG